MNVKTDVNTAQQKSLKTQPPGTAFFEKAYHHLLSTRPGILASEAGGELAWLNKARERDLLRWQKQGLPCRRDEDWKYTNVAALGGVTIDLHHELNIQKLPPRSEFPRLTGDNLVEIVFLNGHFVPTWSKLSVSRPGLHVNILSELLNDCVETGWSSLKRGKFAAFQKHIETSDADRENVFAALNTSFMNDAILIELDSKTRLDLPIVVYHFTDARLSAPAKADSVLMSVPRVFATLGVAAAASLIEVHAGRTTRDESLISTDDGSVAVVKAFTNSVSDVKVQVGGRLSHCRVQMESLDTYHIGTTRIHQAENSWVENHQFSFGAGLSRQDLHVSLEGEGAEIALDGLYLVEGKQKVDHHTSIEHLKPNTSSRQLYKGILRDHSRAVFNGRVLIAKDAQKSTAAQLNNNLLLSSKAEIDTKPQLEIFADDVKASHGATIGQMDPEHVFYLQTRAIGKDQAVAMLAHGFAKEVVYRIENQAVRERLIELVDSQLALKLNSSAAVVL